MKDYGIDRGLVQRHETSNSFVKGSFFGFRKMFWDYLTKLGVPFHDPCCDASSSEGSPVRFFEGTVQYLDKDTGEWTAVPAVEPAP